jgi:hypothetical protein
LNQVYWFNLPTIKKTAMPLPNIFDKQVSDHLVERINRLSSDSKPIWGTMNAGQMLAHCNVTYRYVYEPEQFKPTPPIFKLILKLFVKKTVVNEKQYKQGSPTGPDFKVTPDQNFDAEKEKLIGFLQKTQALGATHFEGKTSHSFGALTATEWNNMFYKHLDHHLRQFGC